MKAVTEKNPVVFKMNHKSGEYESILVHSLWADYALADLKAAIEVFEAGNELTCIDEAYFWVVDRGNGDFYPLPLLWASDAQREQSHLNHQEAAWEQFYAGEMDSGALQIIAAKEYPSDKEAEALRELVKEEAGYDKERYDLPDHYYIAA